MLGYTLLTPTIHWLTIRHNNYLMTRMPLSSSHISHGNVKQKEKGWVNKTFIVYTRLYVGKENVLEKIWKDYIFGQVFIDLCVPNGWI